MKLFEAISGCFCLGDFSIYSTSQPRSCPMNFQGQIKAVGRVGGKGVIGSIGICDPWSMTETRSAGKTAIGSQPAPNEGYSRRCSVTSVMRTSPMPLRGSSSLTFPILSLTSSFSCKMSNSIGPRSHKWKQLDSKFRTALDFYYFSPAVWKDFPFLANFHPLWQAGKTAIRIAGSKNAS